MDSVNLDAILAANEDAPRARLGGEADFRAMIEEAFVFASDDLTRYNMASVQLVYVDEHEADIVATDGHRLLVQRIVNPFPFPFPEHGYSIHRESLADFRRVFKGGSKCGAVTCLHLETGQVILQRETSGEAYYLGKGDEGYPTWRQVIPNKPAETVAQLGRDQAELLWEACQAWPSVKAECAPDRRCTLTIRTCGVTIEIDATDGALDVHASASFGVLQKHGDEISFGINVDYLQDAIAGATACPDGAWIKVIDATSPIEFMTDGGKTQVYTMPLRQ